MNRMMFASEAVNDGSVLPIHEVNNFGFVPHQEVVPLLSSHNFILPVVAVLHLDVRLDFDPVEVFVQAVKQIGNEFARVMLIVS